MHFVLLQGGPVHLPTGNSESACITPIKRIPIDSLAERPGAKKTLLTSFSQVRVFKVISFSVYRVQRKSWIIVLDFKVTQNLDLSDFKLFLVHLSI